MGLRPRRSHQGRARTKPRRRQSQPRTSRVPGASVLPTEYVEFERIQCAGRTGGLRRDDQEPCARRTGDGCRRCCGIGSSRRQRRQAAGRRGTRRSPHGRRATSARARRWWRGPWPPTTTPTTTSTVARRIALTFHAASVGPVTNGDRAAVAGSGYEYVWSWSGNVPDSTSWMNASAASVIVCADVRVRLGELRRLLGDAEQVVDDQHLGVAPRHRRRCRSSGSGANA